MSSIDRIHFGTEAHLPRAELLVHIVQGVSHGINSIDHKLHLSFLLIVGVLSYPLLICKTQRGVHQTHYNHNYSLSVSVDYMHFDHGKCTRRSHMFGSLLTMCEVKMCFWVVKQSGTLNPEDNLILLDTSGNQEQNVFRLKWSLSGSSLISSRLIVKPLFQYLVRITYVADMKCHEVVSKSFLFKSEKSTWRSGWFASSHSNLSSQHLKPELFCHYANRPSSSEPQ